MAEHPAVNRRVAGSSPARGATSSIIYGRRIFRLIFTLPFSDPISCGFFFGGQEQPDARTGASLKPMFDSVDRPIELMKPVRDWRDRWRTEVSRSSKDWREAHPAACGDARTGRNCCDGFVNTAPFLATHPWASAQAGQTQLEKMPTASRSWLCQLLCCSAWTLSGWALGAFHQVFQTHRASDCSTADSAVTITAG